MGENDANIFNPVTQRAETIPKEALGRAQETEGARELTPAEVVHAQKESKDRTTFDPVETNIAAFHSNLRGALGAIGTPLDSDLIDVAGVLGGEGAKKSTRDYLNHLDDAHPYASAFSGLLGTVGGSVAGAEMLGAPGAVSKPAVAGVSGFAQRAAVAGAENVVQSTTKDFDEAALGDRKINGEKLVVAAPGQFAIGAVLGAGLEGAFHGLGALYRAGARRAVPALEGGVNSALGAEVGDVAAGARVRDLARQHGGVEVPASRADLADILSAEQGVQRGRAAAAHSLALDELAGQQATEAAGLSATQEAGRKSVLSSGRQAVEGAERAGAEGTLEAMARGGARVEEAELSGAARRASAGGEAFDANLGASRALGGAGEALHNEVAAAGQAVEQVAEHYRALKAPIESELRTARGIADEIAAERAANSKAIVDEIERAAKYESRHISPDEAATIAQIEAHESAREAGHAWFARDFEPTLRSNMGPALDDNGLLAQLKEMGKALDERSVGGATEASAAHIDRLKKLSAGLDAAHENALEHVGQIEKAIQGVDSEAAKHMAQVGRAADARVASFQTAQSSALTKAEKVADAALANVRTVEKQTAEAVEKARAIGQKEAEVAEKKGLKLVGKARAEADEAHAAFEKLASKERDAMSKLHDRQVKDVPAPSMKTDVDPLIKGMKQVGEVPAEPVVSGTAALGAGLTVLHGNPLAAGAALASSFAAGRLRGMGNLARARALRAVSEQVSKVDNAVREGAALILGRQVGRAVTEEVDEHQRKEAKQPAFGKIADSIMAAQANPDLLERQVRDSLGELANHAPETYAGALLTMQRQHAFLLGILPQPQVDPHSLTPQLDKGSVSPTEQYEFMQAYATLSDPLSIFKDVHLGQVTENQVAAIEQVFPPLYAQIREEVNAQRAQLTTPVDYVRSIHVGTLLGMMTDQVLEPDFQSVLAATYQDKADQAAPKGGAGSKSGKSNKVSSRMMSASEKVEGGQP